MQCDVLACKNQQLPCCMYEVLAGTRSRPATAAEPKITVPEHNEPPLKIFEAIISFEINFPGRIKSIPGDTRPSKSVRYHCRPQTVENTLLEEVASQQP